MTMRPKAARQRATSTNPALPGTTAAAANDEAVVDAVEADGRREGGGRAVEESPALAVIAAVGLSW